MLPVIKHIPGHGRARVDSHKRLPVVDATLAELEARDFAPFRALADLPMAMTAHVVYRALDRARPATTSPVVIADIVRGAIGFQGLLISDDLSMNALKGGLGERTTAALAAGCDVALHCNGDAGEIASVVDAAHPLAGQSLARAEAALANPTVASRRCSKASPLRSTRRCGGAATDPPLARVLDAIEVIEEDRYEKEDFSSGRRPAERGSANATSGIPGGTTPLSGSIGFQVRAPDPAGRIGSSSRQSERGRLVEGENAEQQPCIGGLI